MNDAADTPPEQRPRLFSMSQRIGRLRYFVYTLLAVLGCIALLIAVYLLAFLLPPTLGRMVSSVVYILVKSFGIPIVIFILTIRRLHDINASGWWALTVLMPFVTLLFLFLRGTPGPNRFGPAPAPNHSGLNFIAIAVPIAFIGMYAALYGGKYGDQGASAQPSSKSLMERSPALKSYDR